MKACKIQMITKDGDTESVFRSRGCYARDHDCLRVSYRQDGDEVLLRGNQKFLEMKRGRLLELCFRPKEITSAILRLGDREGGFSVYTFNLSFSESDQIQIFLDYELRFPHGVQKFSLQIFIQSISEEK